MGYRVIVSTLSTGRVHRREFATLEEARCYANQFGPYGRHDHGHRVELYRTQPRTVTNHAYAQRRGR
jgi:hypothetical protein